MGRGGARATHFAGEFEILIDKFTEHLNMIGSSPSWMSGAILGGIGLVFLSLIIFMTGILLIFAKMMLTLMLGLAPVLIALSLFDATKDFSTYGFDDDQLRLLSRRDRAMFSTVIGMANSLMAQLGGQNSASSIGSLVPFFGMIFLVKRFVAAPP